MQLLVTWCRFVYNFINFILAKISEFFVCFRNCRHFANVINFIRHCRGVVAI